MAYAPPHWHVQSLQEYASAYGLDWEVAYDIANEGEPPAYQLVAQNGRTEKPMATIGETAEQAAATIGLAAHAARATIKPDPRFKIVTLGQQDGYGWRKRNPGSTRASEQVARNHFDMSNKLLVASERNRGSKAFKLYRMAFDHGANLAK